jgi:putative oxidoreductase
MSLFDALRIALGLILLPHFILKIPRVSSLHRFYESARLPFPKLSAPIGFVAEGLVVASLLASVFVREGAALGFLFLLGAAVATVRKNGGGKWRWEQGGPEYPLFLAVVAGLIAVYAP